MAPGRVRMTLRMWRMYWRMRAPRWLGGMFSDDPDANTAAMEDELLHFFNGVPPRPDHGPGRCHNCGRELVDSANAVEAPGGADPRIDCGGDCLACQYEFERDCPPEWRCSKPRKTREGFGAAFPARTGDA